MSELRTYPVNDVLYDAEDAELFHCTRTSGVFMGDDFTASVTGADLDIRISEGLAWIRNEKFRGKVAALKTATTLTLPVSDATYSRYDAILLRFTANSGKTELTFKEGSASSNPIRYEPEQNSSVYELVIYFVLRAPGSSVITIDDIEDVRGDNTYCGYMVDDVSAFDEGKFLAKETYDPSDSVAKAGGIAQYVQTNAPKVTVSDSVTSTSTTTAASSSAVKSAYDRAGTALTTANNAIPKSQRGAANGVASLGGDGKIPPEQSSTVWVEGEEGEGNEATWSIVTAALGIRNYDIRLVVSDVVYYYSQRYNNARGTTYVFFTSDGDVVVGAELHADGEIELTV